MEKDAVGYPVSAQLTREQARYSLRTVGLHPENHSLRMRSSGGVLTVANES
jgi:hypothetical protein